MVKNIQGFYETTILTVDSLMTLPIRAGGVGGYSVYIHRELHRSGKLSVNHTRLNKKVCVK